MNSPAYQDLRSLIKERTSEFVFWVGSGPSTTAGLPTWTELHRKVLDGIENSINNLQPSSNVARSRSRLHAAKKSTDLWLSFQILEETAPTEFRNAIRAELSPPKGHEIPAAYSLLWQLRPSGVITTNLDRLVTAARARLDHTTFAEFSGRDAGKYMHILRSPNQFVANLHGVLDDATSWILTRASLAQLLDTTPYRRFLDALLSTRTVIMLGLRADDVAISTTLNTLTAAGIDFPSPFWLTERNDWETFRWTQTTNLRPVFYESTASSHAGLLELLQDLVSFTPRDELAAPVSIRKDLTSFGPLPPQEEIIHLDAESLRRRLNARAQEILRSSTPEEYADFSRFIRDYDEAIHRAWYVSTEPPRNQLLGYTLEEEVATGAFGTVYRGLSRDGQSVAIKILREAIRRKDENVQSFRRGVRSMEILSRHSLSGMVPYLDASEIPAMVVMEFINGMDLREAVRAKQLEGWDSLLYYAIELTDIIQRAHRLPERVLHRDIRPANVMLAVDANHPYGYRVIVLDFDLSWHRGSLEQSISQGTARYLAPEQIEDWSPYSTRNAAVDSYGIGMTLYYMITGEEPDVLAHRTTRWEADLDTRIRSKECKEWNSLAPRVARLVHSCTLEKQPDRPDVTQINNELKRLRDALIGEPVEAADLLAEELLARTENIISYSWRPSEWAAVANLHGGLEVKVQGDEARRKVTITIERPDRGIDDRKRIGKYLYDKLPEVRSIFERQKWSIERSDIDQRSVVFVAELATNSLWRSFQVNVGLVDHAIHVLSLG